MHGNTMDSWSMGIPDNGLLSEWVCPFAWFGTCVCRWSGMQNLWLGCSIELNASDFHKDESVMQWGMCRCMMIFRQDQLQPRKDKCTSVRTLLRGCQSRPIHKTKNELRNPPICSRIMTSKHHRILASQRTPKRFYWASRADLLGWRSRYNFAHSQSWQPFLQVVSRDLEMDYTGTICLQELCCQYIIEDEAEKSIAQSQGNQFSVSRSWNGFDQTHIILSLMTLLILMIYERRWFWKLCCWYINPAICLHFVLLIRVLLFAFRSGVFYLPWWKTDQVSRISSWPFLLRG